MHQAKTPAPSFSAHKPVSAWGDHGKAKQPKLKTGTNRPPKSQPSAELSQQEQAWRAYEADEESRRSGSAPLDAIPEGQGDVPWHTISDTRLTDALVARVDYSNGNLMLAATDFDIAGIGQQLQLTRTYNSLPSPHGKPALTWWFNYERRLEVSGDDLVLLDHSGAAVRFKSNGDGSYDSPSGYSKDLVKESDGTYTLTDRKSGRAAHFSSDGALTKITDRNDGQITVTHHENGGFKLTDERTNRWIDYTEVRPFYLWQSEDSSGRTVTYNFDGYDNLVGVTHTAGKKTVFSYDSAEDGRIWKIRTPEGRETVFTYDSQDRVTSMQRRPGPEKTGPTWTYTYSADAPGDEGTTTVTDPDEDKTVYHCNADGEVEKVTDPLGHEQSATFDAQHNQVTAVDAMGAGSEPGNTTTYGWDSRNNLTSAELPTGATTSLTGYETIAGADLPGTVTSPDGQETEFTYDSNGNTMSVATTGDEGGTRDYSYQDSDTDCGGFEGQRCTAEDADGNVTHFTYDDQGNLTKASPPEPMGSTSYTYDELGRPVTVTDGRGKTLTYTYDARDRVTKVEPENGTPVVYTYDADGNRTSRTDSTGTVTYSYDGLSRETVRTLQDGSQTVLRYNADGQNLDSYTDPQGTVDYTYDAANRLVKLQRAFTTTYEYNADDQRVQTNYPGNVQQKVSLDDSGRPTRITAVSGDQTLVDLSYDYSYTVDGESVDGTKIRSRTDHTTDKTVSYDYGSAGRLTYAEESLNGDQTASWLYCFDPAGNLTSSSHSASSCPGGTDYTFNDASQLTAMDGDSSGWSYDKAGNETAAAPGDDATRTDEQYNPINQLTSLNVGGASYPAEYAGTTNAERTKLGDTTFHHGPLGLAATTKGGQDTAFTREPSGTLNSVKTPHGRYFYLTDALGSVVGLVDAGGYFTHQYSYDPTGLARSAPKEQQPQPYRFAGAYKDPTGLYKMGARYYDPHLGRFTQPDPSGQELNPYLYAAGDPINRIDPSGLFGWHTFFSTLGTSVTIGGGAGALGGCLVAGTVTGGIGCPAGAGVGAGLGAAGGFVAGIGVGIWQGWGE